MGTCFAKALQGSDINHTKCGCITAYTFIRIDSGGFGGYGGAGFGKSAMKLGSPASGVAASQANSGITQKFLGDVASGKAVGGAGVDLGSYLANPASSAIPQAGIGASAGAPGINLAKATMPSNLASSAYNTALLEYRRG